MCTLRTDVHGQEAYASLQAMGCIKPYPGQRRFTGAVSTGRRLGWVWAAGSWIWKDMDKPLANGECTYERCGHGYWDAMEDDENVGGGRIYGEYNKALLKSAVNGNLTKKKTKVWVMEMTLVTFAHTGS